MIMRRANQRITPADHELPESGKGSIDAPHRSLLTGAVFRPGRREIPVAAPARSYKGWDTLSPPLFSNQRERTGLAHAAAQLNDPGLAPLPHKTPAARNTHFRFTSMIRRGQSSRVLLMGRQPGRSDGGASPRLSPWTVPLQFSERDPSSPSPGMAPGGRDLGGPGASPGSGGRAEATQGSGRSSGTAGSFWRAGVTWTRRSYRRDGAFAVRRQPQSALPLLRALRWATKPRRSEDVGHPRNRWRPGGALGGYLLAPWIGSRLGTRERNQVLRAYPRPQPVAGRLPILKLALRIFAVSLRHQEANRAWAPARLSPYLGTHLGAAPAGARAFGSPADPFLPTSPVHTAPAGFGESLYLPKAVRSSTAARLTATSLIPRFWIDAVRPAWLRLPVERYGASRIRTGDGLLPHDGGLRTPSSKPQARGQWASPPLRAFRLGAAAALARALVSTGDTPTRASWGSEPTTARLSDAGLTVAPPVQGAIPYLSTSAWALSPVPRLLRLLGSAGMATYGSTRPTAGQGVPIGTQRHTQRLSAWFSSLAIGSSGTWRTDRVGRTVPSSRSWLRIAPALPTLAHTHVLGRTPFPTPGSFTPDDTSPSPYSRRGVQSGASRGVHFTQSFQRPNAPDPISPVVSSEGALLSLLLAPPEPGTTPPGSSQRAPGIRSGQRHPRLDGWGSSHNVATRRGWTGLVRGSAISPALIPGLTPPALPVGWGEWIAALANRVRLRSPRRASRPRAIGPAPFTWKRTQQEGESRPTGVPTAGVPTAGAGNTRLRRQQSGGSPGASSGLFPLQVVVLAGRAHRTSPRARGGHRAPVSTREAPWGPRPVRPYLSVAPEERGQPSEGGVGANHRWSSLWRSTIRRLLGPSYFRTAGGVLRSSAPDAAEAIGTVSDWWLPRYLRRPQWRSYLASRLSFGGLSEEHGGRATPFADSAAPVLRPAPNVCRIGSVVEAHPELRITERLRFDAIERAAPGRMPVEALHSRTISHGLLLPPLFRMLGNSRGPHPHADVQRLTGRGRRVDPTVCSPVLRLVGNASSFFPSRSLRRSGGSRPSMPGSYLPHGFPFAALRTADSGPKAPRRWSWLAPTYSSGGAAAGVPALAWTGSYQDSTPSYSARAQAAGIWRSFAMPAMRGAAAEAIVERRAEIGRSPVNPGRVVGPRSAAGWPFLGDPSRWFFREGAVSSAYPLAESRFFHRGGTGTRSRRARRMGELLIDPSGSVSGNPPSRALGRGSKVLTEPTHIGVRSWLGVAQALLAAPMERTGRQDRVPTVFSLLGRLADVPQRLSTPYLGSTAVLTSSSGRVALPGPGSYAHGVPGTRAPGYRPAAFKTWEDSFSGFVLDHTAALMRLTPSGARGRLSTGTSASAWYRSPEAGQARGLRARRASFGSYEDAPRGTHRLLRRRLEHQAPAERHYPLVRTVLGRLHGPHRSRRAAGRHRATLQGFSLADLQLISLHPLVRSALLGLPGVVAFGQGAGRGQMPATGFPPAHAELTPQPPWARDAFTRRPRAGASGRTIDAGQAWLTDFTPAGTDSTAIERSFATPAWMRRRSGGRAEAAVGSVWSRLRLFLAMSGPVPARWQARGSTLASGERTTPSPEPQMDHARRRRPIRRLRYGAFATVPRQIWSAPSRPSLRSRSQRHAADPSSPTHPVGRSRGGRFLLGRAWTSRLAFRHLPRARLESGGEAEAEREPGRPGGKAGSFWRPGALEMRAYRPGNSSSARSLVAPQSGQAPPPLSRRTLRAGGVAPGLGRRRLARGPGSSVPGAAIDGSRLRAEGEAPTPLGRTADDWSFPLAFFQGILGGSVPGAEAGRSSARLAGGFTTIDLSLLLREPYREDAAGAQEESERQPASSALIPSFRRSGGRRDYAGHPYSDEPDAALADRAPGRSAIERPLMALLTTQSTPSRIGKPLLQRSAIDQPEDRSVGRREQPGLEPTEGFDEERQPAARAANATTEECCEAETRERIHRLAAKVFPLLRHRLRVEAERIGRF
jgi:hypothetical protein